MRNWTRGAIAVVALGAVLSFGCKKDEDEEYGDNAATTEYETPATTETTEMTTDGASTDMSTDMTTESPPSGQ